MGLFDDGNPGMYDVAFYDSGQGFGDGPVLKQTSPPVYLQPRPPAASSAPPTLTSGGGGGGGGKGGGGALSWVKKNAVVAGVAGAALIVGAMILRGRRAPTPSAPARVSNPFLLMRVRRRRHRRLHRRRR